MKALSGTLDTHARGTCIIHLDPHNIKQPIDSNLYGNLLETACLCKWRMEQYCPVVRMSFKLIWKWHFDLCCFCYMTWNLEFNVISGKETVVLSGSYPRLPCGKLLTDCGVVGLVWWEAWKLSNTEHNFKKGFNMEQTVNYFPTQLSDGTGT